MQKNRPLSNLAKHNLLNFTTSRSLHGVRKFHEDQSKVRFGEVFSWAFFGIHGHIYSCRHAPISIQIFYISWCTCLLGFTTCLTLMGNNPQTAISKIFSLNDFPRPELNQRVEAQNVQYCSDAHVCSWQILDDGSFKGLIEKQLLPKSKTKPNLRPPSIKYCTTRQRIPAEKHY